MPPTYQEGISVGSGSKLSSLKNRYLSRIKNLFALFSGLDSARRFTDM